MEAENLKLQNKYSIGWASSKEGHIVFLNFILQGILPPDQYCLCNCY
jgi:hypothetical protein